MTGTFFEILPHFFLKRFVYRRIDVYGRKDKIQLKTLIPVAAKNINKHFVWLSCNTDLCFVQMNLNTLKAKLKILKQQVCPLNLYYVTITLKGLWISTPSLCVSDSHQKQHNLVLFMLL